MRNIVNIFLLAAFLFVFLSTGWVSYSAEKKECPATAPVTGLSQQDFMGAHGITQENFSIWLQEHSEWRKKYSDELKNYSFIPKENPQDPEDFDPNRR
jgi:hypothetical protein